MLVVETIRGFGDGSPPMGSRGSAWVRAWWRNLQKLKHNESRFNVTTQRFYAGISNSDEC